MEPTASTDRLVYAGDLDGLDCVYTAAGRLIPESGEATIRVFLGFDVGAFATWRPVFPKRIFSPYSKPRKTRLHVTTHRIVLIREIDVFKETDPLAFPEGFVAAVRVEDRLRGIQARGARYYCVIRAPQLRLVRSSVRRGILFTKLQGPDGSKYSVFFHTEGAVPQAISLITRQFRRPDSRD